MTTKRVRWECPEHGGALLAPTRLRKIDVRRYCLPCSEKKGVLVERFAPALEKARQQKAEVQKAKKQKALAKQREKEAAYYTVAGLDLREELKWMRKLKAFGGSKSRLARRNITLKIRRATSYPRSRLGYADYWSGEIGITSYPGIDEHDVRETLLHELVHLAVDYDSTAFHCHHGREFKTKFRDAMDEAFGFVVNVHDNVYHGKVAAELRRRSAQESA